MDNKDNYENILNRLDNISKFEYNWNGYEAKGFNNEIGLRVIEIARELWEILWKCECEIREKGLKDFRFNVFPTGRCSVQFEIRINCDEEKDLQKYFEVEVFRNAIFVFKCLFEGVNYNGENFCYSLNDMSNDSDKSNESNERLKEIGEKICGECRKFFIEK